MEGAIQVWINGFAGLLNLIVSIDKIACLEIMQYSRRENSRCCNPRKKSEIDNGTPWKKLAHMFKMYEMNQSYN